MKATKANGISFKEWMQQLNSVAIVWGYKHKFTPEQCWHDYWDQNYQPEEALREDEIQA